MKKTKKIYAQEERKEDLKELMTIDEVCDFLKVKKATIYSYTTKKLLTHYKLFDRKLYFRREDILNLLHRVRSKDEIKSEDQKRLNRY